MESNGEKLRDYVIFPKYILSALRNGKITQNEYDLYAYLRHSANPYGITPVSLSALEDRYRYRGWSKNYINKLILSLRKKAYLGYPKRSGCRGEFEVRFPDFITPSKHITRLSDDQGSNLDSSERSPRLHVVSPRPEIEKEHDIKPIAEVIAHRVRGSYTDIENIPKGNRLFKQSPNSFKPKNYEEEVCREIALELREDSMAFLLGTKHKHGFRSIQRAWGIYCQDIPDKAAIQNKAAYFNAILSNLLKESQ